MPRLLKNKIAQANNLNPSFQITPSVSEPASQNLSDSSTPQSSRLKQRRRIPGVAFTPENVRNTKNIVLNFGKAISAFATSPLAVYYLRPLIQKYGNITLEDFQEFVKSKKNAIGGISSFRPLLVITDNDSEEEACYKKVYRAIGEVFIKFFSVNWIIHGKMQRKDIYLKYRFKMLRRIQNPDYFTYLKNGQTKSAYPE